MTSASLSITPYERHHRQAIDNLVFHSHFLHTHLDWFEPLEWLNQFEAPVQLAWEGKRLVGLMAASPPVNQTTWIRIAALRNRSGSYSVFEALWCGLAQQLATMDVQQVYVLIMRDWLLTYIREHGFRFVEDVITMEHPGTMLPELRPLPFDIRYFAADDLAAVTRLDHEAFPAPWQMTRAELHQALRVAALCTLARLGDEIVGYQISTEYRDGAHLARLGVAPAWQGQGIGTLLLHDLLNRFFKRSIASVTVNTQASNLRSQHLYRAFGFYRNGYDLPVWSVSLHS